MPPAAEAGEQPQAVKVKVKVGTNNNNNNSSSSSCVGTAEPENLQCPRCESTNTKFCYYNNYNLSQPRYFCKSCRRYWTRGGSLRNIPVGGGSRKKHQNSSTYSFSSSKRPRKKDPVPILNHPNNPVDVEVDVDVTRSPPSSRSTLPAFSSAPPVLFGNNISSNSPLRCDMNLNEAATNSLGPPEVSFTSLLGCGDGDGGPAASSSSRGQPPQGLMGGGGGGSNSSGFLGLSSWGLGFSSVSDLDGMGFGGFGKGPDWADVVVGQAVGVGVGVGPGPGAGGSSGGSSSGCNTWQLGAGEDGDGLTDGGDCFAWPDLAISTPRAALD